MVHEVAHIFHNCKRRNAGLPETRRKEWLLDIEFRKRETLAGLLIDLRREIDECRDNIVFFADEAGSWHGLRRRPAVSTRFVLSGAENGERAPGPG